MRLFTIGSGSSGNCACLYDTVAATDLESAATPSLCVLVDAGVSPTLLLKALASRGLKPGDVTDLFITHEHDDHARFLDDYVRKMPQLRLHATSGTAKALARAGAHLPIHSLTPWVPRRLEWPGRGATAGANAPAVLDVLPMSVSHDAQDPVSYRFDWSPNGALSAPHVAGYLTDLGRAESRIADLLAPATALFLESNHDEAMLKAGPYPAYLKKRIASTKGHLSNRQARTFLDGIVERGVQVAGRSPLAQVLLGHLSATNNTPEAALACATEGLALAATVDVAPRTRPSPDVVVAATPVLVPTSPYGTLATAQTEPAAPARRQAATEAASGTVLVPVFEMNAAGGLSPAAAKALMGLSAPEPMPAPATLQPRKKAEQLALALGAKKPVAPARPRVRAAPKPAPSIARG